MPGVAARLLVSLTTSKKVGEQGPHDAKGLRTGEPDADSDSPRGQEFGATSVSGQPGLAEFPAALLGGAAVRAAEGGAAAVGAGAGGPEAVVGAGAGGCGAVVGAGAGGCGAVVGTGAGGCGLGVGSGGGAGAGPLPQSLEKSPVPQGLAPTACASATHCA